MDQDYTHPNNNNSQQHTDEMMNIDIKTQLKIIEMELGKKVFNLWSIV